MQIRYVSSFIIVFVYILFNKTQFFRLFSVIFQPSLQLYELKYINIQKSNVHIGDIMPKQEEDQIFQFVLTVLSVKMKVKFPCKMALQQAGRTLTTQVYSNEEGRFVFNQEIRLREQSDKLFSELNICLITEKGARYISGIAKLYHNEILRSQGQRIVVTLSKCLDTQSFCELRVEKIIREGPVRPRTLTTIPERNQKYLSPRHNDEMNQIPTDFKSPKKGQPPQIGFQSKSQSHFPVTGSLRIGSREDDLRARDYAAMTGYGNNYRKSNVSPKGRSKGINSKSKYQPLQFNPDYQREKVLQGQVYRQNYQKLKQKYLKEVQTSKSELNKRIMLENNQNNYKLEIVRLKLKTQELEKALIEKNLKLKELSLNLSSLQGVESELNILREDLANKQHAIDIMDDTIITLSKENDELRLANKQNFYKLQEKILILQNELQMSQTKSIAKKEELQREIKNLSQALQHKQVEINRKTETIEKQKKNIYELEKNLQNKLFQYDSQLQNERNLCRQKIDENKLKIQEANQVAVKLNLQKGELSAQIDKLKGLLLKNQYQFKLYHQQINSLKAQIEELKIIRDKYNEMVRQLRSLSQQKIILERNHEKIVVSKQNTIQSVTNQYKKQIQNLKKVNKEFQDKTKGLSTKFIQSESQLEISRIGLQKLKRTNENINKELIEFKEREKVLKKSIKSKQQELQDNRKELNRLKQKNQSLLDSTKMEISKNRDQLSRIKIQLESQVGKNQQLVETNSQLNMELARMKMSQQFSDQKCEKLSQSAQEKYAQFQKIIKEHQSVIELFEQKIRVQKATQKDYISKLQKYDYQINLAFEKNEKLLKELRLQQQKNRLFQNALKSKQGQIIQNLKRISDLQQRTQSLEQQKKQLKDQLQFNHNQLQKSKKIVQILQKDYEKAKIDIISYCQKLNERQKQLDDKILDCKKEKDNLVSSETKYNSLKKEYQRFKDSISQALTSSFTQAVQTFSTDKYESVKTSNFNDVSAFSFKRGILDLNNDLVTAISSAGKENKTQIQKLTQKTRTLQRDLDLLKSQLQRAQQTSRKQLNQKTRQIEELEQQLRSLKSEKGEVQVQNHLTVGELQQEINHYKSQCQSLISTKDQLQFSLGSLRLQVERLNDDYQRKLIGLQNQRNELYQKLQYQCHNTEIAQKRAHDIQIELMNLNSVLILQKEQIYKKEVHFAQSDQEKERIIKELQSLKRQLKQSEERYTELDIQFTTMKQIKQKYESELNEEESKLKQVRIFNKNILKEKEEIIKKELQKNLEVTELQNTIVDLRYSLQQESELKTKFKSDLEQTRELAKKYLNQVKDLQSILGQQKAKYNQIRDRLRQKEQVMKQIKQENINIKSRLEQNFKKGKVTTEQLEIENNKLYKQIETIKIQSHQKISILESQILRANQQVQSNKEEISELEQALFVERENNNSMHQSINRLKQEIQDCRKKLEEMEKVYEELAEQNKQKDQNMFEMGGKLYEYETRMRELQEQKLREIEQLNNSLSVKYDEDYQEINQKIEFIQKEREYFKEKYNQKEQEVSKKNEEIKHHQIEQMEFKKMYQEKIRKLQEEKLAIFTDKNKEITKALDQNKAQFQLIRNKQAQLRKVTHQLQISRNTIQKFEAKLKEMQSQKQTQIKAYQAQIQNLRKKQLLLKNLKDTVKSNQWSCERQVRKQIQNLIKKWLQGGQKQVRNETLISSIKSMEESLLGAISNVGKELQ